MDGPQMMENKRRIPRGRIEARRGHAALLFTHGCEIS